MKKNQMIPILLISAIIFLLGSLILNGHLNMNFISIQKAKDSKNISIEAYYPKWQNQGVGVTVWPANQSEYEICSDGSGGAFITWMDYRTGNRWNIYAQHINTTGQATWSTSGVSICNATNDQEHPKIYSDGSGGAVITWQDYRGGFDWDIYAQRVDSSGNPNWTTDGIPICTYTGDQIWPQIFSKGDGNIFIAWRDSRGIHSDIYMQLVNLTGHTQWADHGSVICNATNKQNEPVMCDDGADGVIVAWEDERTGAEQYDIYAQRVNSSGETYWTNNGTPLCTFDNKQNLPQIISDGNGGAIVVWMDNRAPSAQDIYAQRVNSSGNVLWGGNGSAVTTGIVHKWFPRICTDMNEGVYVAWEDPRYLARGDVYVQHLNSTGHQKWGFFGKNITHLSNNQISHRIVSDGLGGAILTWADNRTGTNIDVYAQWINSSGHSQWTTNGVAVCTINNYFTIPVSKYPHTTYPHICSDENGGAIIIWGDNRSGYMNIYAQNVKDGDAPTSNQPDDINLPVSGLSKSQSEEIGWILWDKVGPGKYRVWVNDTNGNYYIWQNWKNWTNNTDLAVPINKTAIGRFNYTIEFNSSRGIFGKPDTVLVCITSKEEPPLDLTGLIAAGTTSTGDYTLPLVVIGAAGAAVVIIAAAVKIKS